MSNEAPVEPGTDRRAPLPRFIARTLVVAGVLAVVGYFALGMPGMDHGGGSMASMDDAAVRALEPAEFAAAIEEPGAYLVDVHVPTGVRIPGTDARIPYDEISTASLPEDENTTILLYCRTGAMSEDAAMAVLERGYTDVAHLAGGTDAWTRAGRSVDDPS